MRVPHPRLQGCTQPIEHGAQLAAYLAAGKQAISRAEAEERMFAKLAGRSFLADVRPLLAAEEAIKLDAAAAHAAFGAVFQNFIKRSPGNSWKKTKEMAERFSMPELADE